MFHLTSSRSRLSNSRATPLSSKTAVSLSRSLVSRLTLCCLCICLLGQPIVAAQPPSMLPARTNFTLAHEEAGSIRAQVQPTATPFSRVALDLLSQTGGGGTAVFVSGNYAYLGVSARMVILDISDAAHPQKLGSSAILPDVVTAITVVDRLAYVVYRSGGLRIINVTDPFTPVRVADYDLPSFSENITVAGGLAFVANSEAGLYILDVTTPETPRLVGRLASHSATNGVAVVGHLAYVTDGGALLVVDVTNPAAPVLRGSTGFSGQTTDVIVVGTYAYVSYNAGIMVIDVSDPGRPVGRSFLNLPGYSLDLALEGSRLFVAGYGAGLHIVDISNPLGPYSLGSYSTHGSALTVQVKDEQAYVMTDSTGLVIFDVHQVSSFSVASTLGISDQVWDVAVRNDLALVSLGDAGFEAVDVSDVRHPRRLGAFDTPGSARHIAFDDRGLAYIADIEGGLIIVDVADPAKPRLLSILSSHRVHGVDVSGTVAYVAAGEDGLLIVDVSNPMSPTLLGVYDTAGIAFRVRFRDNLVWLADGDNGLLIIDVSHPAQPILRGRYSTGLNAYDFDLHGNLAFYASSLGLHILDISDPANPRLRGRFEATDASLVQVFGDQAYLISSLGMQVLDIRDPSRPVSLFTYAPPWSSARGFVVTRYFIYLGVDFWGLMILDKGSLHLPGQLAQYLEPGPSNSSPFAVQESSVFVEGARANLQAFDLSDPARPSLRFTLPVYGGIEALAMSGDLVLVANRTGPLQLVDVDLAGSPGVVGTYNPELYMIQETVTASGYAYVLGDTSRSYHYLRIQIIDLHRPSNPVLMSEFEAPPNASVLKIAGTTLFVAGTDLTLIDVSNPANPTVLGTCCHESFYSDLDIVNGLVYAVRWNRVDILDVHNPTRIVELGSYVSPEDLFLSSVALVGANLLVGAMWGIFIFDVSHPSAPRQIGYQSLPGGVNKLSAQGDRVIASGRGVLTVLAATTLSQPQFLPYLVR